MQAVESEFLQVERVMSYVEIYLQLENSSYILSPAFLKGEPVEGANPIWNQTKRITISTQQKKKLDFYSLSRESNCLKIILFDQLQSTYQYSANKHTIMIKK